MRHDALNLRQFDNVLTDVSVSLAVGNALSVAPHPGTARFAFLTKGRSNGWGVTFSPRTVVRSAGNAPSTAAIKTGSACPTPLKKPAQGHNAALEPRSWRRLPASATKCRAISVGEVFQRLAKNCMSERRECLCVSVSLSQRGLSANRRPECLALGEVN